MYNYLNKHILDGDEETLILVDGAGVLVSPTSDGQKCSHGGKEFEGVELKIRIFDEPYTLSDLFVKEEYNGKITISIDGNMRSRMKNVSVSSDHSSITLEINTDHTYKDIRIFVPYDGKKVKPLGDYPEISKVMENGNGSPYAKECIEFHGVEKTDKYGRIIFVNNYNIVESSMLDVRKMSSDQLKIQSRI